MVHRSNKNKIIQEVTDHKHLGITFSRNGTWHEHITEIKDKSWKRINIMRKLKFVLDRISLETIYVSFIRPLLEYSDVVWDNITKYEEQELENIQLEAARIVTGSTKLVSINALYIETGWETLKARRHKHKLILYYKMKFNIAPQYLCTLIPPLIGQVTQHNLRNVNNTRTISCNSQLYYNSFLPSTVRVGMTYPSN